MPVHELSGRVAESTKLQSKGREVVHGNRQRACSKHSARGHTIEIEDPELLPRQRPEHSRERRSAHEQV
jgi:hypothetical protein